MSRQARGDLGGALLSYRRVQRRFPDFPDAWANASALLCAVGRFDEARQAAETALALAPGDAAAAHHLAAAQAKLGRLEEAAEGLLGVVERGERGERADGYIGRAQAMADLAGVYNRMGRHGDAALMAQRAVEADDGNWDGHHALAAAHRELGDANKAAAHYRMALARRPDHVASLAGLVEIYIGHGHMREAVALCDAELPHNAEPQVRSLLMGYSGQAKMLLGALDAAENDLTRAAELDPGSAAPRWGLAYLLAVQGRCREAWAHVRACHAMGAWELARHDYGKPHWEGGPLVGGTLLVYSAHHSTGGCGDVIQFSRYFPQIRERFGCRLVLCTYASLARLLEGVDGIDGIVAHDGGAAAHGGPLPHFDAVAPVGGLPTLLDIDLRELPPPTRLSPGPPPEFNGPAFRVGLCWAGSASTMQRAERDMDPGLLGALADVPGAARIAWYGLQKDPSGLPDLPAFTDMSGHMGDFMDTARITAGMDLVATVDTSMAHLAATLGVPTYVLLPKASDWRWGLGKATPWYPAVRLLRQAAGGWEGVVAALGGEIAKAARRTF
jgi:tetratricopeptide (TPR) repeat protein